MNILYISRLSMDRLMEVMATVNENLISEESLTTVANNENKTLYEVLVDKNYKSEPNTNYLYNGASGNWYFKSNPENPVKLGKILKSIFPELDSTIIGKIVAEWGIKYKIDKDLKMLKSSDIEAIYNLEHYPKGTVGNSCMRNNGSYYTFLMENFDVGVLYLTNSKNTLIARALLWKNVYFPQLNQTVDFMDRIYYTEEKYLHFFQQYATKNNMVFKKYQSYQEKGSFIYENKVFYDDIKVHTKHEDYVDLDQYYLPFLDTLSYCEHIETNYLTNDEQSVVLDSTCGEYTQIMCEYCDEADSEMNEIEVYGEGLMNICSQCLERYYVYSEQLDAYIESDEAYYCLDTDDYLPEDEVIYDEVIQEYVSEANNSIYSTTEGIITTYGIESSNRALYHTENVANYFNYYELSDYFGYEIVLDDDEIDGNLVTINGQPTFIPELCELNEDEIETLKNDSNIDFEELN